MVEMLFLIVVIIFVILEVCVIASALWDWTEDKKYAPAIEKAEKIIGKSEFLKGSKDVLSDPSDEFLLVLGITVALFFYLLLYMITIPMTALIYGAYYIRRTKKKNKESQ